MNKVLTSIRGRFLEFEKREQNSLILLGSFFLVVIFYLAIWIPVNGYVDDQRIDRDRHLKLLQYLKSTESEAKAVAGNGNKTPASSQSLLTQVSRTAQSVDIKPSRMQPEGGDAVSVWFDAVGFTKLMLWLERLESRGIVVRQVTIERRDVPGQVSSRLVLRQ